MKENKGITLVALIITIIVMMILVAVSVAIIIKSDLLGTAKSSGTAYRENMNAEQGMGKADIKINNDDTTMEDYIGAINGEDEKQVIPIDINGNNPFNEDLTFIPGETWRQWARRMEGTMFTKNGEESPSVSVRIVTTEDRGEGLYWFVRKRRMDLPFSCGWRSFL